MVRLFDFIRSVGQAALLVQERRAQVRADMYTVQWEITTAEIPAAT